MCFSKLYRRQKSLSLIFYKWQWFVIFSEHTQTHTHPQTDFFCFLDSIFSSMLAIVTSCWREAARNTQTALVQSCTKKGLDQVEFKSAAKGFLWKSLVAPPGLAVAHCRCGLAEPRSHRSLGHQEQSWAAAALCDSGKLSHLYFGFPSAPRDSKGNFAQVLS